MILKRNRATKKGPLLKMLLYFRKMFINSRLVYYRKVLGMDIGDDVIISLRANLDFTNPRGIHIGSGTLIAFNSIIFAHDMSRVLHTDTYIGCKCFIGAGAIIMPGVRVGDECIVGAGAVVTRDVPSGSIVAGNPARIVKSDIRTENWGVLSEAYKAVKLIESEEGGR